MYSTNAPRPPRTLPRASRCHWLTKHPAVSDPHGPILCLRSTVGRDESEEAQVVTCCCPTERNRFRYFCAAGNPRWTRFRQTMICFPACLSSTCSLSDVSTLEYEPAIQSYKMNPSQRAPRFDREAVSLLVRQHVVWERDIPAAVAAFLQCVHFH